MANPALTARAEPILARLPADQQRTLVEVGVYAGDLACYLLERRPLLMWQGVDPWRATGHSKGYVATGDFHATLTQAQQDDYYSLTRSRVGRYSARAVVRRNTSMREATLFMDEQIDIIWIDGDHSWEGCLADCRAWWPKVKPGGWLSGHDFANPNPRFRFGVEEAVREFSTEVGLPFELDGGLSWWMRKT